MPNKIMIDIETLGTKPGCIVRELGIVVFNETEILESYQYFFDIKSQEDKGLITEWDTAQWVLDNKNYYNPENIKEKLFEIYPELKLYVPGKNALFFNRVRSHGPIGIYDSDCFLPTRLMSLVNKDTEIWVNGTTFDIPILEHFFKTFSLESPFKYYYNIRDFRTLKKFLNFSGKSIPDEPFPHLAVSDAIWQVKALQAIYKQRNNLI